MSCGTVASAKLLLLSGVGPAPHLNQVLAFGGCTSLSGIVLIPFSSVFLCRRICQWGKTCRTISQQPLDRSCLTPLLGSTHSLYSAPSHIYRLASLCNRTAWCHCVCRLTIAMTDSKSYPVPCSWTGTPLNGWC